MKTSITYPKSKSTCVGILDITNTPEIKPHWITTAPAKTDSKRNQLINLIYDTLPERLTENIKNKPAFQLELNSITDIDTSSFTLLISPTTTNNNSSFAVVFIDDIHTPKKIPNTISRQNILATASISLDKKIIYANSNFHALFEKQNKSLIGIELESLFRSPSSIEPILSSIKKNTPWEGKLSIINNKTSRIFTITLVSTPDDKPSCFLITSFSESYTGTENQSDIILNQADISILSTNVQGIIIQVNECTCRQFGYSRDELLGTPVERLMPPHIGEKHQQHLREFLKSNDNERAMKSRSDIAGYRKDGSMFPAEASVAKIETPNGKIFIATLRDISSRIKTDENLIWRAEHDALTGLPNRVLIHDRLYNALNHTARSESMVALMFIDLDNFKLINDNYGHDFGDQVLVSIANRLINTVRPGDTVGRFGGDEFIVICDQIEAESDAEELANRIIESFRKPIKTEHGDIYATVSLGMSIGNSANNTAESLLSNADAAMYSVKNKGRDSWGTFNERIISKSKQQLSIITGLHEAITKNQLSLHYQPIIDFKTGQTTAAEALLRWQFHSQLIAPAVFIPIAEMNGSIIPIGNWVLKQACQMLSHWCNTQGSNAPDMSINFSARQINQNNLPQLIRGIIDTTKAPPEKIILEITETALMSEIERTIPVLNEIADIGIRFSIDDFGTGYSSLSQLMRLPVSTLKIDQAFIEDIDDEIEQLNITSAIINMAHSLNMKTIAEGVETTLHASILKQHHCDYAQGYYFSRPLPAEQLYPHNFKIG